MKYKRTVKLLLALTLLVGSSGPLTAASRSWETARTEHPDAKSIVKDNELEIKTVRGKLLLTTTRPTQIKVVTILGRTICSDTVQPGAYQLTLAHGVYLVKVGEMTLKVAL